MRYRHTTNALLFIAVLLAGIGAWWLYSTGDDGPRPLAAVDPGAIRRLELRYAQDADTPTSPLELERREDGWHLVAPIERPARDGRVVSALAVVSARSDSCYATGEHDPADFGLDEPRLTLRINDSTRVEFGDRAADGRRYVASGDHFCLLPDRSYPLLAQGVDGLAVPSILRAGAAPVRIETPGAAAQRPNPASEWKLEQGEGDAGAWAARWMGAQASHFVLAPPASDLGHVRIGDGSGETHDWRIAQHDPKLILVPAGAEYGMTVADPDGLLAPPPASSGSQ